MNRQQVARAGELFVAAEIHRRGGYAVTFAGNMPGIDILASDIADQRRISIQVKTKTSGSWHARGSRDGIQRIEDPAESSFWVFVDLAPAFPTFYVTLRWWVQNDIWTAHTAYLEQYEASTAHHGRATITGFSSSGLSSGGTAGMFWRSSSSTPRAPHRMSLSSGLFAVRLINRGTPAERTWPIIAA